MEINKKLSQKDLKSLLDYDPDTGLFKWKKKIGKKIIIGSIAGSKNRCGYMQIRIRGVIYLSHRLAVLWMEGYFPENEVDHINRNRADNKWANLREVSHRCNLINCKLGLNNKSGVKGVSFNTKKSLFRSRIKTNKKDICLGNFPKLIDAVFARWQAELKYGFPNCISDSTAFLYLKSHNALLSVAGEPTK